jgi:hypothetical protein
VGRIWKGRRNPKDINILRASLVFLHITLVCFACFLWRCGPTRAMASSFLRFLDHTQRRITVGRTPLDEWSARRRDPYLKTHNTHNRQTSAPPGGIRTHDLGKQAAADLRLRPRGYWDRHITLVAQTIKDINIMDFYFHLLMSKLNLLQCCIKRDTRTARTVVQIWLHLGAADESERSVTFASWPLYTRSMSHGNYWLSGLPGLRTCLRVVKQKDLISASNTTTTVRPSILCTSCNVAFNILLFIFSRLAFVYIFTV